MVSSVTANSREASLKRGSMQLMSNQNISVSAANASLRTTSVDFNSNDARQNALVQYGTNSTQQ